jgi:hypothetical protein
MPIAIRRGREPYGARIVKLHLALTAAALFSTAALAQNPGGAAPSPFDALDADQNGSLSAQEAQVHPVVAQNFGAADKDGDGKLTREEFDAAFTTGEPAQPSQPGQAQPGAPTAPPPATSPPQ